MSNRIKIKDEEYLKQAREHFYKVYSKLPEEEFDKMKREGW